MARKSKAEYEGIYRIKRKPRRMAPHNLGSWEIIERVIELNSGRAEFDLLAAAVIHHKHGTESAVHPYQFVTYCIRRGWLERM